MSLLSEEKKVEVAAAIADVEQHTDAELVAVLARRSDEYHYIPTLWAAGLALLAPFLIHQTHFWLDNQEIALIQLLLFVVVAIIFRWPPILVRLIPKKVRFWRASNLARRQFLENNLHHTAGETGILIFISELEHYVEIIADRGISQHVEQQRWQAIIDALVAEIKKGRSVEGLKAAIYACGEILIQHVPITSDKNELPNHLVCLE